MTQESVKKPVKTVKLVDAAKYQSYADLKTLDVAGAKLTEDRKKDLDIMEKAIKACSGKVPNKTVRAAVGNEILQMFEGVPVPAEFEKIVASAKATAYYFG